MHNAILRLLIAASVLLSAAGTWAQTSNTSAASAAVFETKTDKFMSVVTYGAIGDYLLFLGLTNSNALDLGFSKKLGDIYVGGYYNGGIVNTNDALGGTPTDTTAVTSTLLLDGAGSVVGQTSVTSVQNTTAQNLVSKNKADVIVGFAGMGIKAGVDQDDSVVKARYQIDLLAPSTAGVTWSSLITPAIGGSDSRTVTTGADLSTVVAETSEIYTGGATHGTGKVQPHVSWGMNLDLGSGLTLTPYVDLKLGFNDLGFTQSWNSYVRVPGSGNPSYQDVAEVSSYNSRNYNRFDDRTNIDGTLRTELELKNADQSKTTFGLSYNLVIPAYGNTYTDTSGQPVTVAGTAYDYYQKDYTYAGGITTVTETRMSEQTEITESDHVISPELKYSVAVSQQLDLGFRVSAPLTFGSSISTVNGKLVQTATTSGSPVPASNSVDTITKTFTGDVTTVSSFSLAPALSGGLRFAIVPEVLKLNVGGRISLPLFSMTETNVTKPGLTTRTELATNGTGATTIDTYASNLGSARTETQTAVFDWTGVSSQVAAGLTLTLAPGIDLDTRFSTVNSTQILTQFSVQLSVQK